MKWAQRQLGSLCSRVTSGGTPSTKESSYYDGDIPWLRTQEVNFNFIADTEIKITEAGLENSAAKWIPENSVIVALYGNSAGRVAINKIPLTTNQACGNFVLDPNEAEYRFVYYSLLKDYEVLHGMARGAAQNNLNVAQVKEYAIKIPSLGVQQRIADILSAYDDLIENNRRRMALLEDAARQLYREWFVRLRFPGHEHTPIAKGVPEGWERNRIGDIADCVGGGTPSTGVSTYWDDGDITWVTPTDVTRNKHFVLLDSEKKITEAGLQNSSAKLVAPHAILMTSRASVGFFAIAGREVCTNQGFISVVPRDVNLSSYLLFHLGDRVEEIRAMGSGSTYPEVSRGKFREFEVLIPKHALLSAFDEQVSELLKQIRILKRQNQGLQAARDLLLPRLMSGAISV